MVGDLVKVDVHVHLAGVGTQGSGCWTSPAFRRRPSFLGLRLLFGITDRQMETTADQDWIAMVSSLTAESELDHSVVLGFDGVYAPDGELDHRRSQMVIPFSWVFEACDRYSNLLPGPSINPYRRDALDALEEVIERGAVLIKWLPIVQGFDPASPSIEPFLRRLADAGIPLLVHAGSGEVTFRTVDPEVGDLRRIVPALEMGVKVICAHAASPIHYRREEDQMPLLRSLMHRYPNLWADNSGLANPSRFRHLPRLASDAAILERTLHGSDFPVISDAFYYPHRIAPRKIVRIQRERNKLQREIRIKRSLGFPEECLSRPAEVLANLDGWTPDPGSGRAR
ncbi:MAG: amidohydrolase family protein [Gemmatimonadota bacterium]